ncbi:MAG: response regulator [Deltaproteobacteria bacterium]|nr:response regulator [Deltaproteobacteria bacterium]
MFKLAYSETAKVMEYESRRGISKRLQTVLLIDDEEVIVEVTRDILETMGYRVLTASTGSEAIERYRMDKDRIDMVILDMIMPGMGGEETFEQLKAINPAIKVILSSGYGLNNDAKRIMARGAQSFLVKPFHIDQLLKKISDVLANDEPLLQQVI